jgi:phenylalanine-4-hydroxylase
MAEIKTNLEKLVENAKTQVKSWETQWESLVSLAQNPDDAKKVTNEKFLQGMATLGLGLRADIQSLEDRIAKLEALTGAEAPAAKAAKPAAESTAKH